MHPEKPTISAHEIKLILALQKQPERWMTNDQLAESAGVSGRTARAHTHRLARLGVLSVEKVFPSYLYRLSGSNDPVVTDYLDRVRKVREMLGI